MDGTPYVITRDVPILELPRWIANRLTITLPVPLSHGQFSRDAVGLLPQLLHTTASDELALFQQPHGRRHP